jgi:hypothetical protein
MTKSGVYNSSIVATLGSFYRALFINIQNTYMRIKDNEK